MSFEVVSMYWPTFCVLAVKPPVDRPGSQVADSRRIRARFDKY